MERSERIRQQERIVQVVAATLIGGVAVLGGLAYFLSQAGRWSPMDPATGRIVLYAGMGVMAIGLLGAPVLGARLRDSLRPSLRRRGRAEVCRFDHRAPGDSGGRGDGGSHHRVDGRISHLDTDLRRRVGGEPGDGLSPLGRSRVAAEEKAALKNLMFGPT